MTNDITSYSAKGIRIESVLLMIKNFQNKIAVYIITVFSNLFYQQSNIHNSNNRDVHVFMITI